MPEVTVAAGGKIFKACGHLAHKANQVPVLNTLLCINAYTGQVLWTRKLSENFMIHRNAMIATPETFYLADDVSCKRIDPDTGKVLSEITLPEGLADGPVWKWLALQDGVLYGLVGAAEAPIKPRRGTKKSLGHWGWGMWDGHDYKAPKTNFGFGRTVVAMDPKSGKVIWKHKDEQYLDGRGLCMSNDRLFCYSPGEFLLCLDSAQGKELWKATDDELLKAIGTDGRAQQPKTGYSTTSFIKCDENYIYFAGPQRPNLVIASSQTGKLLWQKKDGNCHLVLRKEAAYFVGPSGGKFEYGTWNQLATMLTRRACTRATGSIDSVFYRASGGTVRIDTPEDKTRHIAPMRPPCQDGVIISDGLLLWGPWMCGCQLSVYGHIALAPAGIIRLSPEGR